MPHRTMILPPRFPGMMLTGMKVTSLTAASVLACSVNAQDLTQPDTTAPDAALMATPTETDGDAGVMPYAFSVSLFFENDGAKIAINPTDRNYTSGQGFALAWREDPSNACIDPWLNDVAGARMASGITIGQLMYTPDDIEPVAPLPDQHPYLGYLYVGGFAQRTWLDGDTPVFEHLELDLGVVGPSSLAEEAQKEVHRMVDEALPQGWINQDGDEPAIELTYTRKWRIDLMQANDATWQDVSWENNAAPIGDGWGAQLIPALRLRAGTVAVDAQGDVMARWGWNLPDDFGPANLQDLPDYTGLGLARGWSAYVFAGGSVRLVAHDIALDGGLFDPGKTSVDGNPVVGVGRFGVASGYRTNDGFSLQANWTMSWTSERYDGQEGADRLGQVGVTMRWVY